MPPGWFSSRVPWRKNNRMANRPDTTNAAREGAAADGSDGRPGVCHAANACAIAAKIGIVAVIIVQLMAIAALPLLVGGTRLFSRQREVQELCSHTDAVRKRLNRIDSRNPLLAAYLDLLRDELNTRVRFLRRHANETTEAQRRAISDNLDAFDRLLDTLERRHDDAPDAPFAPDIDPIIRTMVTPGTAAGDGS